MESIKHTFLVDRSDINYLRITLESYDGMAVVRTIDPHEARIEIMISPGCEGLVNEVLASLVENEGLSIVRDANGPFEDD